MSEPDLFAFVLMPFDASFADSYRLGIKEPAAELGIRAERVDEQIYAEGILERIYRQIDAADIVIADMTGQNANVFYEVGYAHAKEKLCILLTQEASDIPFDLKHRRHIVYGGSIQVLREQLKKDLEWAKVEVENVRKSRIKVVANQVIGWLEKTDQTAHASVDFSCDLHNDTDGPSVEILSAYFYTRDGWTVFQNKDQCAVTASDLPLYQQRHYLASPTSRLPRNGWAQLRFKARRLVAAAWRGDVLEDRYSFTGTALLRLQTDQGHFDYEIPVTVVTEVFPF